MKTLYSKSGLLYKFRSWSNEYHRNALLRGEFFLASPKDFNDPFDCQVFIDYSDLNTIEKRVEFVNKAIVRDFDHLIESGYNVERAMRHMDERVKDLTKFQEDCNQISTHIYQKYYGILSLANTWNPMLLWSHYADHHKGFCLGIKEEKILELSQESNVLGRGALVNYEDCYPNIPYDIDWFELALIQSYSKAKCWEYEEEYRLLKTFYPSVPNDEDRMILLKDAIVEVTLGVTMPEEHKEEIIEFSKSEGIKVYQAKKASFKFEIEREELL